MNHLCFQMLASMLPFGMTTRRALLTIPFGDYSNPYLYKLITKMTEEKILAECKVQTKKDKHAYHHPYLMLTMTGLRKLIEYASEHDISVGKMERGAIGYEFLQYVNLAEVKNTAQYKEEKVIQTLPGEAIASLLREKEMEAIMMRGGVRALPFERTDPAYVIGSKKNCFTVKGPNIVAVVMLRALQAWRNDHPIQCEGTADLPEAPTWYSARTIRTIAGDPGSTHRDFMTYDGVVLDRTHYTVIFHTGHRGTAWAADANRRLCAYLDNILKRYDATHYAVMISFTWREWSFLWEDPYAKRNAHKEKRMQFGKPFRNLYVFSYCLPSAPCIAQVCKEGDAALSDLLESVCEYLGWTLEENELDMVNVNGREYYLVLMPQSCMMEELLHRYRSGERSRGIIAPFWLTEDLERLFPDLNVLNISTLQ